MSDSRILKRFIAAFIVGLALCSCETSICTDGECTISLKPGEGAVLVLGDKDDYQEIRSTYFQGSPPPLRHDLDRLAFGFTTGWPGAGGEEKLNETFELYESLGATFVFGQGDLSEEHGADSRAQKFITIAENNGLRAIVQPRYVYWHPSNCNPPLKWPDGKGCQAPAGFPACMMNRLDEFADALKQIKGAFAWSLREELLFPVFACTRSMKPLRRVSRTS